MKIACLHTADSNIAIYEDAARALGLPPGTLHHHVRADLLLAAERVGELTPDIETETAAVLRQLAEEADAVVLNCSTLGPAALLSADSAAVPVIRADGVLAQRAVADSGRVIVLCTVETTIAPTTRLFETAAKETGAKIEVRLIPGAWALFRGGDQQAYLARIAAAAEEAYRDGARTVAFAQASMTGALQFLEQGGTLPMTGPAAALQAAVTTAAAIRTSAEPPMRLPG